MTMRILITGNLGYVGPSLVRLLRHNFPSATLVGFDCGYFASDSVVESPSMVEQVDEQYFADIRDISPRVLEGVDAVIHLCAISNDPIGNFVREVTFEVNLEASKRLYDYAIAKGVGQFVFASSCSVYGKTTSGIQVSENDELAPLTAYASSKSEFESYALGKQDPNLKFTSLRFPTACGWSSRLRLDLVLNDFLISAMFEGKITILSDGSPWRPLIDVEDMARCMVWALNRPVSPAIRSLVINAGRSDCNYQVRDIAERVARIVGNTNLEINDTASPDDRSYSVNFSLFEQMAGRDYLLFGLDQTIARMITQLRFHPRDYKDFRDTNLIRLNKLRHLILNKEIDDCLRKI